MHYALVAAALCAAGAVSGATGLAFPLIAGPVLLLRYSPADAIMISAACSLVGQALSMSILRRAVDYEVRWQLILPGVAGVPVGAAVLMFIHPDGLRLGFGALMVVSCILFFFRPAERALPARPSAAGDGLAGFCGGLCGALFGVASVIPACWLCLRTADRNRQRAIVQPYIFVMQSLALLSVAVHAAGRIPARDIEMYLPAALAGVCLGTVVFRRMTSRVYANAVLLITFASGITLLWR